MTTNARDEKWGSWIEHDGKSLPIDDRTEFQYRLRSGTENKAYNKASDYRNCFIHEGDNSDIIAYRYKIKEPESEMHPDLKWLAENVSEWDDNFNFVQCTRLEGSDPMPIWWQSHNPFRYAKAEWQAARQKLGLDQPEVTPEEEEAWKAKERSLYGEIKEGFDSLEAERTDNINKPKHYQLHEGYEVYDLRQDLAAKAANGGATYDQYSDWDRAIEYIIRMWGKNRLEDAKKGRWYLDKLIGKLEDQESAR